MAVLGLILLAAAGVLTAAVVTSNTTSLSVELWGVNVSNITVGVVFVAGMITTVLAVVGLGLVMGALRRGRRLRSERRSLRRENQQLAQRVESTDVPADQPHEPAPVWHDSRPMAPGDTTVAESVPPYRMDDDTTAGDLPRRRGFLPRRDESATDRATTRN